MINLQSRRVLRTADVCAFCGMSRASLHRRRAQHDFPPPIKLGPQMIGWRLEDVERWISERPTAGK